MARALPQCGEVMARWKSAATAEGGSTIAAEDMARVTALPPWEALAGCVERHAGEAGVSTAVTLQHVATEMGVGRRVRHAAQQQWVRAAQDCEPMRRNMQANLLDGRADANERDEVLLMQAWMYGLASRLERCQQTAAAFAQHAGMRDAANPLLGLDEDRWALEAAEWREMEDCVHAVAREADADVQQAWRPQGKAKG